MLVLTIRTDQPDAEVCLYDGGQEVARQQWYAHRELSVTLHKKIDLVLAAHQKTLQSLEGIVCFRGPGSFTGLRIGLTVANTLAYARNIPIVGTREDGWIHAGLARLLAGENDRIVLPHYGAPVHITTQKK